jgi:putative transcriptional regulator
MSENLENIIRIRKLPDGSVWQMMPDGSMRPYVMVEPDYAMLDNLSDDELTRRAEADDDSKPFTDEDFETGRVRVVPRVRDVREKLGLNQIEFAQRYRISIGALRDWEQGRAIPDSATRAYLSVIAKDPETVARLLG